MKTTTKKIASIFAASTLAIGISSTVFAQSGTSGQEPMESSGHGNHHGGSGVMKGETGMMMGDSGAMKGQRGNMMKDNMQGNCGMMMQMHENPEEWLAKQKAPLAITAEQEEAWNAYAAAIIDKAALMQSHRQLMMNSDSIEPEQRFELHRQGLQQMEKTLTAAEDLYGELSPEQREQAGGLLGM